jgi:hypothetical protein
MQAVANKTLIIQKIDHWGLSMDAIVDEPPVSACPHVQLSKRTISGRNGRKG